MPESNEGIHYEGEGFKVNRDEEFQPVDASKEGPEYVGTVDEMLELLELRIDGFEKDAERKIGDLAHDLQEDLAAVVGSIPELELRIKAQDGVDAPVFDDLESGSDDFSPREYRAELQAMTPEEFTDHIASAEEARTRKLADMEARNEKLKVMIARLRSTAPRSEQQ